MIKANRPWIRIAVAAVGAILMTRGLLLPTTRYSHGPTITYWADATGDSFIIMQLAAAAVLLGLCGWLRPFRAFCVVAGLFAWLAFGTEAWQQREPSTSTYGIAQSLAWGWSVILSGATFVLLAGILPVREASVGTLWLRCNRSVPLGSTRPPVSPPSS